MKSTYIRKWDDYEELNQSKTTQFQTINSYLIQKKNMGNPILPGRPIEKIMYFRFMAKDLIYNTKAIRDKVMRKEKDFAQLERQKLVEQQLEEVDLKQFIFKIQEDKMNYFNEMNK